MWETLEFYGKTAITDYVPEANLFSNEQCYLSKPSGFVNLPPPQDYLPNISCSLSNGDCPKSVTEIRLLRYLS